MGFPCSSAGKESAHNVGNLGSIPGLGRSPGDLKGYPLWYSGFKNSGKESDTIEQLSLLLFPRHGSRPTPRNHFSNPSFLPPFTHPLPFGYALCKAGLVPTTSQEREFKWVYAQSQLTIADCITTDSVVYVFSQFHLL